MTGIPHQKTWLITGASSGLGKSLARHVLGQGHLVLGTTRTVDRAKEQYPGFEKEGGVWVAMDPGRADTYDSVLKMMEKHEIDVVVNNAGFAFIGGVENSRSVIRASVWADGPVELSCTAESTRDQLDLTNECQVRRKCVLRWRSISMDPFASYGPYFLKCARGDQGISYSSVVELGKSSLFFVLFFFI